jgi:DUF2924 family protein
MAEKDDTLRQIGALRKLTVGGLRKRYLEVFGEETRSSNKQYLFKKIAYRIQEKKHGGLSDRAKRRAEDLANDSPIHRRPKLGKGEAKGTTVRERDPRLPAPGSLLKRIFGDKEHTVRVLENGFKYDDKPYRSLSAIAREITGTSWNGFGFFGLLGKEKA